MTNDEQSLRNPRKAGRKPQGESPKAKINVTIDADLVEWVDAQGARSTVINAILRQAKNGEKCD